MLFSLASGDSTDLAISYAGDIDLDGFDLVLSEDGTTLTYTYDTQAERTGITRLIAALGQTGLVLRDLSTRQSSLEEVFLSLVEQRDAPDVTPSPKGDAA